ncbi:MAG: glycoside hydrolase family 88 protein [Chitinophagales bacterium]
MKHRFIATITITLIAVTTAFAQNIKLAVVIKDVEKQTDVLLQEVAKVKNSKPDLASPRTVENGELKMVSSRDWTSGFFPGQLWFLYEYTGKKEWKEAAEIFTANLEREKTNAGTHDMGFKIYCSFGSGYRLTKNAAYRDIIIQSAKTLSTRFKPVIGCIRSWDSNRDKWGYPVIIDNMMNLELLFRATQLTGDSSFYRIAVTHANTTMLNHYRPDHSSYHVVDYDTVTGKVVKKNTHQGAADESAWARGQSWGLYGYTMCYRFTRNKKYLQQAENIASFLLNHPNLPKDYVPYWDFNAPNIPDEERDASAASILASGLYELSTYSKNGRMYKERADKIIESLTNNYRSAPGENKGFILIHCVGHKPAKSEIDVPIDYADYYFIEALLRSKKLKEKKKLF